MKFALALLAIIVMIVYANSEEGKMLLRDLEQQARQINFEIPEPRAQDYPVVRDEFVSEAQGRPNVNQYRFQHNQNTAGSTVRRPADRNNFVRRNGY